MTTSNSEPLSTETLRNATESAFPTNYEADCETCQRSMAVTTPHPGLTKRELLAAMAMQGYCAEGVGGVATVIATESVKMADALLKELAK